MLDQIDLRTTNITITQSIHHQASMMKIDIGASHCNPRNAALSTQQAATTGAALSGAQE